MFVDNLVDYRLYSLANIYEHTSRNFQLFIDNFWTKITCQFFFNIQNKTHRLSGGDQADD